MKYKVGDEVLVKVQIVKDGLFGYGLKTPDSILFTAKKDGVIPIPDMTAEEAWEIVRKIIYEVSDGGMTLDELRSVYGTSDYQEILSHYSPQQAKDKIEAWEAEKEIKVGDEVIPKYGHYRNGERGLVVCINDRGKIGVNHPGNDFSWYEKESTKKTGRHIDIDGLLKQIEGTSDGKQEN